VGLKAAASRRDGGILLAQHPQAWLGGGIGSGAYVLARRRGITLAENKSIFCDA